jgi:hypothetical protein
MYRQEQHTNFCQFYRGLFLKGIARGKSTAEDGTAIVTSMRLRLDAHDCRRVHPSERRNLEITNEAERRQDNGYPHTRSGSRRFKCSNGPVDCRIWTLDRGKEKNHPDAPDSQDDENSQFPSDSSQDHRSVT